MNCFSRGAEVGGHRNDHPFRINDHALLFGLPLWSAAWSAAEDLQLLEQLAVNCNIETIAAAGRTVAETRARLEQMFAHDATPPVAALTTRENLHEQIALVNNRLARMATLRHRQRPRTDDDDVDADAVVAEKSFPVTRPDVCKSWTVACCAN